jgi:hypothetical protein
MSDRADEPLEQSPIARLGELQIAQFISGALRAGQRAILVTGRGQVSTRVPEAALSGRASARALHIGPPLPEPPELQEMIAAAAGVAGGRQMTPQAMALLLRLADPRPRVILAIDEAHTLSRRSLAYLALMTELLASEAAILQIVLAAGPSLLDTLAQPEFESLRNSLSRPLFETIQTLRGKRPNEALLGLQRPHGRAAARLAHVQNNGPAALSRRSDGIARRAVRGAVGLVAICSLAVIGYNAFLAFMGPTLPPSPSLHSDARFLAPSGRSQSLAQLGPGRPDEVIDLLIDETVDAVASGSVELTSALLERIAKLESGASPDSLKWMPALEDRVAARMAAAERAGRIDEARHLEQVFLLAYSAIGRPDLVTAWNQGSVQSPQTAVPSASDASTISGPAEQREISERPEFPPSGSAVSAEQLGEAGDGDRVASSLRAVAPATAPRSKNVRGMPPARAPDSPSTPSAEQLGEARDGDRAALSPRPAAPGPSSAAPEQNIGGAPPAILARAEPIAPNDRKARVVTGLPTLAPVRVVLNVARGDEGRAADIQHALVAAGVQTDLVPVDARRSTPRIGYYFQSDRNAAADVSHLLTPLLGAVDPAALRIHGSIPEPGTIEITIR